MCLLLLLLKIIITFLSFLLLIILCLFSWKVFSRWIALPVQMDLLLLYYALFSSGRTVNLVAHHTAVLCAPRVDLFTAQELLLPAPPSWKGDCYWVTNPFLWSPSFCLVSQVCVSRKGICGTLLSLAPALSCQAVHRQGSSKRDGQTENCELFGTWLWARSVLLWFLTAIGVGKLVWQLTTYHNNTAIIPCVFYIASHQDF